MFGKEWRNFAGKNKLVLGGFEVHKHTGYFQKYIFPLKSHLNVDHLNLLNPALKG